jgi:glycosyltransferase involved in cell wall biosynthesis
MVSAGRAANMRFRASRFGSWWQTGGRAANPRPSLAVVTCMKNEGEDLVEWLCFHRHIGVSRFLIYDNLSTDRTLRILNAIPFRDEITVLTVSEETAQMYAFRDAIKRFRDSVDWVAFLDGDEFIVPLGAVSIGEKLAELERAGIDGIGICWRIFGSGGHRERPPGLVTESFTRRARDGFKANRHVKSIVRMNTIASMANQHYFRLAGRYVLDDGSSPPADFNGIVEDASFGSGFAIHHYITKSRAQCLRKIARGRPRPSQSDRKFRLPTYFAKNDRNEVEDRRAAEVIAPIRDEVLRLRAEIEAAVEETLPPAKLARIG